MAGTNEAGEKESLKQRELTLLHAGWSHVNAEGSFKRPSLGRHSKGRERMMGGRDC